MKRASKIFSFLTLIVISSTAFAEEAAPVSAAPTSASRRVVVQCEALVSRLGQNKEGSANLPAPILKTWPRFMKELSSPRGPEWWQKVLIKLKLLKLTPGRRLSKIEQDTLVAVEKYIRDHFKEVAHEGHVAIEKMEGQKPDDEVEKISSWLKQVKSNRERIKQIDQKLEAIKEAFEEIDLNRAPALEQQDSALRAEFERLTNENIALNSQANELTAKIVFAQLVEHWGLTQALKNYQAAEQKKIEDAKKAAENKRLAAQRKAEAALRVSELERRAEEIRAKQNGNESGKSGENKKGSGKNSVKPSAGGTDELDLSKIGQKRSSAPRDDEKPIPLADRSGNQIKP